MPYVPPLNGDQQVLADLHNLDRDQLIEMLKDDQYLDDYVEEFSYMKSLNSELDELIGEVDSLSQENMSRESRLSELKTSVNSLTEEIREKSNNFHALLAKYAEKSDEFEPENIRQLLEIAVSNAENECDEIVEEFLHGNRNTNEFLEEFMKIKKLKAIRKFKEERLNYQLRQMKM